jgi:phosphoribosylformylglycinamidine synthase
VGPGLVEDLRTAPGPIPMPVGHGEGRFVARPEVFEDLARRGQVAFRYVRADGAPAGGFPANPNGSMLDVAGLCDPRGRVLALMPHPERGAWLYQVPEELPGSWGEARRTAAGDRAALLGPGPGLVLYRSFVRLARGEG